jgi:hypothetical protein
LPDRDFVTFSVGPSWQIYDVFYMNSVLKSVTLSLKNLIGLVPISLYRQDGNQNCRSAFYESTQYDQCLPRVVIDLNLARPVHLALIDGIKTVEGEAGAWERSYNPVPPGLVTASKSRVAADAVSTAVMGFDPNRSSGSYPFSYADNHLALAREAGLGTNRLDWIITICHQIKW